MSIGKFQFALLGVRAQGLCCLRALLAAQHYPIFVVTLPGDVDEIQRWEALLKPHNIPLYCTETLDALTDELRAVDVVLVSRFNLIAEELFSLPRLGCVNLHPSLLPKYRGVHPIAWALINGEHETGMSLHKIDPGIDSGELIWQQACSISETDTVATLTEKLICLAAELAVRFIAYCKQEQQLPPTTKQTGVSSYARRRTEADNQLSWFQTGRALYNLVRTLQPPYPYAYFYTSNGRKIYVEKLVCLDGVLKHKPGQIIESQSNRQYIISCADGYVQVTLDQNIHEDEFLFSNLGQYFLELAQHHAENTALWISKTEQYTYAQLSIYSRRIAKTLQENPIGDVLAILQGPSVYGYAAMLACLITGIAYVNLDPKSPLKRLQSVLDTCAVKYIAYDLNISKTLIDLDDSYQWLYLPELINREESDLKSVNASDALAYVMFTSGSTGKPKGVAIGQKNLFCFIDWIYHRFEIMVEDKFSQANPIYFDNSVFDFYGALFNGAALVPVNLSDVASLSDGLETLTDARCSIFFAVPSAYHYLLGLKAHTHAAFAHIRHFVFGGEGFAKSQLLPWYERYKTNARFTNVYGPTECTCICSSYIVRDEDFMDLQTLLPLGHANPNVIGFSVDGELYLSGPLLAHAYYHDEARTQERFIEHDGRRCYRTGDLVSFGDGLWWFQGRCDNQIKHKGYRIELEEIEWALATHEGISEVAVIYQHNKIIAYYVSEQEMVRKNLQMFLQELLPNYMLPDDYVFCKTLTKNANGKVDRRAFVCNDS